MTPHPVTADLPAQRPTGHWRILQLSIGIVVSGVLLWLTLRQINLADVRGALRQARLWYLVPAIATYFVDLGVRTWRWRALLRPIKPVGWRQLYPVMIMGYMGNMLLPARMGEVVRAAVLRRHGIAVSAALGSIATERVLDGLTTVAILLAASRFLALPDWLVRGLITLTVLFLGLLLVLAALLIGRDRADAIMAKLSQRAPALQRPRTWLAQFVEGLGALRSPGLLGRAVLIGLLAWACSALQYLWVFRAFNLPLGAAAAFFAVSTVGLSTAIPAAPGYVGSFDFVGVAVLGLLGIGSGAAFSAILTIHLLQIVPVSIAGMLVAWREGISLTGRQRRPPLPGAPEA